MKKLMLILSLVSTVASADATSAVLLLDGGVMVDHTQQNNYSPLYGFTAIGEAAPGNAELTFLGNQNTQAMVTAFTFGAAGFYMGPALGVMNQGSFELSGLAGGEIGYMGDISHITYRINTLETGHLQAVQVGVGINF